ncbi:MAG: redoxin family protein [Bdellovibrionales bacterium]|nr:redoxin family protein [Bdellovibrionales bacterium]
MHRLFPLLAVSVALSAFSARADFPATIAGTDVVGGKPASVSISSALRATVVAFLSAVCPCSGSHEAELESLRAKYEAEGFRFIGVHANQDEAPAPTAAHFKSSPIRFPIVEDAGAKLADAVGALKTPHVYVVKPDGEILYQGGVDDSHQASAAQKHFLADALAAIASGRRPDVAQARTLGCVISRR